MLTSLTKFLILLFLMKISTLVKKLEAIEKMGTRVASFTYHGKRRNVIVGANTLSGIPSEGRSFTKSQDGNYYLVPRVMNDTIPHKAFRLDRITDFQCASVNHIK